MPYCPHHAAIIILYSIAKGDRKLQKTQSPKNSLWRVVPMLTSVISSVSGSPSTEVEYRKPHPQPICIPQLKRQK